jgi:hypothetical protein
VQRCLSRLTEKIAKRIARIAIKVVLLIFRRHSRPLVYREAEGAVRSEAFRVHARENGNFDIDVVVHLDTRLGRCRPKYTSDVLNNSTFECQRKRQEERVELREVESFPKKAPSCQENQPARGCLRLHIFYGRSTNLLAHPSAHHNGFESAYLQFVRQLLKVLSPLSEHQAVSASLDSDNDITTDLARSVVILNNGPEDLLDAYLGSSFLVVICVVCH